MTQQYVYMFSEGDRDQKDLLGGKGANQAVAAARLVVPASSATKMVDALREVPGNTPATTCAMPTSTAVTGSTVMPGNFACQWWAASEVARNICGLQQVARR